MPIMWVKPLPRKDVNQEAFLGALCALFDGNAFLTETMQRRFPDCEFSYNDTADKLESLKKETQSALQGVCERIDFTLEPAWWP